MPLEKIHDTQAGDSEVGNGQRTDTIGRVNRYRPSAVKTELNWPACYQTHNAMNGQTHQCTTHESATEQFRREKVRSRMKRFTRSEGSHQHPGGGSHPLMAKFRTKTKREMPNDDFHGVTPSHPNWARKVTIANRCELNSSTTARTCSLFGLNPHARGSNQRFSCADR